MAKQYSPSAVEKSWVTICWCFRKIKFSVCWPRFSWFVGADGMVGGENLAFLWQSLIAQNYLLSLWVLIDIFVSDLMFVVVHLMPVITLFIITFVGLFYHLSDLASTFFIEGGNAHLLWIVSYFVCLKLIFFTVLVLELLITLTSSSTLKFQFTFWVSAWWKNLMTLYCIPSFLGSQWFLLVFTCNFPPRTLNTIEISWWA